MVRELDTKGHAAFKRVEFEEAIQHYSGAIKPPEYYVLYAKRSLSYASLRKYKQALKDAKKTVELNSDWCNGYKHLGDAYQGLGKHMEAIDAYKKGLELDPENIDLREELGNTARQAGKFKEAIQYESDAIKLAPENHLLYSNRSLSYTSFGKYQQALEDAKRTVELKPDWWQGYSRLGYAYKCLGKYEEAINAFKEGLACDPGNIMLVSDLDLLVAQSSASESDLHVAQVLASESDLLVAQALASKARARRIFSHGPRDVLKAFRYILWRASDQRSEGNKMVYNTTIASVPTEFKVTKEELNGVQVATQLNDYIYEFYKPPDKSDMDVILVHGLQLDGTDNQHLSTWISGYVGSYHAWSKTWLAQDFPHARVLTVAYDSHLYQTADQGRIDLHNTAENLMNCLLLFEEYEASSNQPVVLVGYSFGGILIKQLCLYACRKIFGYHGPRLKSFLERIRAIYFMGTPHHGMIHEGFGLALRRKASPLFKDVKLLNMTLARLHEDFDLLRRRRGWQISSIGESNETRWGTLQTVLVPEASARYGEPFSTVQADHISLSKPATKKSLAYIQLEDLIKQAYKDKGRRFKWTSNLAPLQEREY